MDQGKVPDKISYKIKALGLSQLFLGELSSVLLSMSLGEPFKRIKITQLQPRSPNWIIILEEPNGILFSYMKVDMMRT